MDRDELFEEGWTLIEKRAPREDSGLRHLLFASLLLDCDNENATRIGRYGEGRKLPKTKARFIFDNWEKASEILGIRLPAPVIIDDINPREGSGGKVTPTGSPDPEPSDFHDVAGANIE